MTPDNAFELTVRQVGPHPGCHRRLAGSACGKRRIVRPLNAVVRHPEDPRVEPGYKIRVASPEDGEALVEFTVREAQESQGIAADTETVRRGVSAAFLAQPRSCYWVVENSLGQLVAGTSVVTEWSDFHGGDYWWVQSLYILPEHRGGGLIDLILAHLAQAAKAAHALDLRLYVHRSNERAIGAYRRCGFTAAPYLIMQRTLVEG